MPYRKDYKVFSPLPKNLDIPANNSKKYLDCKEDLQTRKILYAHPSKRSNLDKTEIITFSTITGLTTSLTLLTMGILNDFELGLLGIQLLSISLLGLPSTLKYLNREKQKE